MAGKSQSENQTEHFVQQIAQHQNRLLSYIYSLLADESRAADVLQETNLVLWRRMAEYQPRKPFLPWAFAIARYQVLAHLRDQSRDRVLLTDDLVELVAAEAEEHADRLKESQRALQQCLQDLGDEPRRLLDGRYFQQLSIAQLAESFNKTASATKVSLLRIRRQLATCIQNRLAAEVEA